MAQAKTMPGSSLFIKVEITPGSGIYTHPCLINAQRGIQFTAETADTNVPDCDDPEKISWVEREKRSLSAAINGEGVLNTPDSDDYFSWFEDEDPRNVRVTENGVTGANGGGAYHGSFHLTSFEVSGDKGTKASASIALQSTGAVERVANA